jgi:hypothetical protein
MTVATCLSRHRPFPRSKDCAHRCGRGRGFPDASIVAQLEADLRRLAPALIEEVRFTRAATTNPSVTIQRLVAAERRAAAATTPIEETGLWEFASERNPTQSYRVTYGRAGHLECTCKGFEFRGNCKHVREVKSNHSKA